MGENYRARLESALAGTTPSEPSLKGRGLLELEASHLTCQLALARSKLERGLVSGFSRGGGMTCTIVKMVALLPTSTTRVLTLYIHTYIHTYIPGCRTGGGGEGGISPPNPSFPPPRYQTKIKLILS